MTKSAKLKFQASNKVEIESIAFTSKKITIIVNHMHHMAQVGHKPGWMNIGPALTDAQISALPQPSIIGRWLSGRGPIIPMATWAPPRVTAKASRANAIASNNHIKDSGLVGVSHGKGPKGLERLKEGGLPLPTGWYKVQDHAKNGIVVQTTTSTNQTSTNQTTNVGHNSNIDNIDYETVLQWMLQACRLLCPIKIDEHWIAEVFTPSGSH